MCKQETNAYFYKLMSLGVEYYAESLWNSGRLLPCETSFNDGEKEGVS